MQQDQVPAALAWMRDRIEHDAIWRAAPGTRVPAKQYNQHYTWQFYLRRVMFDPQFVATAAQVLTTMLPLDQVQFAACEDAGVPLALALAAETNHPMISIKKTRKSYGLLNWSEGMPSGRPLVLVDDLAGSQTTLRQARACVTAYGLEVMPWSVTLINKTRNAHVPVDDNCMINLFTCRDFALTWPEYVDQYGHEPRFGSYF